jgi:hypothetical protein
VTIAGYLAKFPGNTGYLVTQGAAISDQLIDPLVGHAKNDTHEHRFAQLRNADGPLTHTFRAGHAGSIPPPALRGCSAFP